MKKQVLAGILASTMALSALAVASTPVHFYDSHTVHATQRTATSGKCGDNVFWSLNASGTLVISGEGPMDDVLSSQAPWHGETVNSVVVEDGVTHIGSYMFYRVGATTISLPTSVESIGKGAFYYTSNLESITIPQGVTTIESATFSGSGVRHIDLPNTITSIMDVAFHQTSFSTIHLPASITTLSGLAFQMAKVVHIVIPEGVTSLDSTFRWCDQLQSVYIPASVTSLSGEVFEQNFSLTDIYYGGTQQSWLAALEDCQVPENATVHFNMSMGDFPSYPSWSSAYANFGCYYMDDLSPSTQDNKASRGAISKYLYYVLEGYTTDYHDITDVRDLFNDLGDYSTYIAWCYTFGLMGGIGDNQFGTDQQVSREQFALILQKTAGVNGKITKEGDASQLSNFSDQDKISSWATSGVAWAVSNGLMNGNEGVLNPQGDITLLEVAIMLYNFDKL